MIYYIYFHSLSWEFRKEEEKCQTEVAKTHTISKQHILSFPPDFFFWGGDNSPNKMQTLFEFNLDGLTHIKHKIAEFLPSLVLSKKI